jgi:hypothetical protein
MEHKSFQTLLEEAAQREHELKQIIEALRQDRARDIQTFTEKLGELQQSVA